MARIKIKDLPEDQSISQEDMKKITGGLHAPDGSTIITIQLQEAINQQAQLMQTMSNIMKAQGDTAMSIIRNLK